jgi:uncharacterized protein YndB with AHSA1/START domain
VTGATSTLNGDELIAARSLPAVVDRVWDAFTQPAGVAAFWGGSHATVPVDSVTIDLRVGGEFSMDTCGPDGANRRLRFVYISIKALSELVFDEPFTGLRTTVRMDAASTGTVLTIHQHRLPPELRTSQAAEGLASILDALATYLTSESNPSERTMP